MGENTYYHGAALVEYYPLVYLLFESTINTLEIVAKPDVGSVHPDKKILVPPLFMRFRDKAPRYSKSV